VHIPYMAATRFPGDTSPDVLRRQFALYANMTAADRARSVSQVTLYVNELAMAGLRHRHPSASEDELQLRRAVIRIGEDLVARAYDWHAPRNGA
jgi:hypothetical protein